MVSERKRGKDIEKIHELIDSASVPKRKTTSLTKEEQLQLIRKHLASESLKNQKRSVPVEKPPATPENLTPQVVVHNKQETQKKEEKVIQIDLGPRKIIKEEEPAAIKFLPIQEDVFPQEPLFEIEKVEVPTQEFTEIRAGSSPKESEGYLTPLPVTRGGKEIQEHLPEFQPVPEGALFSEASKRMKRKKPKAFYQRSQQMNDEQTSSPISLQEEHESSSFDSGGFQPLAEERKEPMRFEMQNKERDSYKQRKIEEKQHVKLHEREAKQLAKEQEKRLKRETLKSHQKKQEEQQRKNWELRQAFAQAEQEEREEQRLLKEQEKKSRLEIVERQQREKEQRKQKKREEKTAKLELKEKKREAKQLAKEHDKKLKLEWIEFQHQQRQKQKQEELDKRKAAVEAKQQEQEEQHLLKEREEQLRLAKIQLMKKEQEEREQKKREKKQAKQFAKGQEKAVHIETVEAQPQIALQQGQAGTVHKEEQTSEEQRLLTETEEKPRLGLRKQQKKEKERPRHILAKKEKKKFVFPLFEKKKPAETQTDGVPWETFQEDTKREPDRQDSLNTEEPTPTETQKLLLKEIKRQQKQLEREQKKQTQQERLEIKKKEKQEKKQRMVEEKQRSHLFGISKENKEMWQGKNEEETFSKREIAEKERDEKRRLKEEQKRKERAFAIEEMERKKKEKNEKKLKEFDDRKERRQISMLSFGKGKDTEVIDEHKQAEQQRQTMDLVRIAAEERDLRKTRTLERKMKKEERKKEKMEQKYKMKEEDNVRKKMSLHMQEEIVKEKLTNNKLERNDPFAAFDSIDQEIASVLDHYGYTSVEKLRQATVKDLMKTGLKKKTAQKIIAECGEFVEWQVFDSIEHF